MGIQLTERQQAARDAARRFAAAEIAPWAGRIDDEEAVPASVLMAIKRSGYLGAALPLNWGGGGIDAVSYGLVLEEIGRVSASVCSLLTAHNMSGQAIVRFGTPEQQARWMPDLCTGRRLIGFGLSEPDVGSATSTIRTGAVESASYYSISGAKKWVTFGQVTDLFLVFVKCDGMTVAIVVERAQAGLEIESLRNIFGTRGSMLAQLHFDDARVAKDCQIGPRGTGTGFVAGAALDHGRFSVACVSTGIMQGCLDACLLYAQERQQGESRLVEYQLVRRKLADMLVAHTAARALCYRSACLRDQGDPRAVMETVLAKYYAAGAAIRVATDAVQLHGANGCSGEYPVSRYLRDATVMGIIEGTQEIHQLGLASYALQRPYLD